MKTKSLLAALAAATVALSLAQAQNEQVPREHRMGRAVPAAGLINRDVVTQSGKNVGQIEEVIFDMESGRILYVALNSKGAGQGDMVAVPPALFSWPQGQGARKDEGGLRARLTRRPLVIRANEQALQGAPKKGRKARTSIKFMRTSTSHAGGKGLGATAKPASSTIFAARAR